MTNLPTFTGTPAERALAEQIHEVMRLQGRFFAFDAPIRQRLSNLITYFAAKRGNDEQKTTKEVVAALTANAAVFAQHTDGDDIVVTTARVGGYTETVTDTKHSLGARLYEPVNPLPVDDLSVVMTTTRPVMPKIDPVYVSDYWLSGGVSSDSADGDIEVISDDTAAPHMIPAAAQSTKVPYTNRDTRIALPQGITVDIGQPMAQIIAMHGDAIVHAMRNAIEKDPMKRFVMFGNQVAAELDVRSFGKNEIRSITEYIEDERAEPVLDKDILDQILRVNPRSVDYERQRFALNVRLQKDLEFVGVPGANLWATRKLLDKIGANKRIKSADIVALVNHLEEGFDDSLTVTSAETLAQRGTVEHKLTFFEWEYGVLPFNDALAAILPSQVINRQNNAVLTFDVPQRGFSTNINVRFPIVGIRGGWLQGFDQLFHDIFVPGAVLSISRTTKPNVFTIAFKEGDERVEDLLYVDDSKKKSKFAFAETSFTVEVDEEYLPTRQRVGNIRKIKFFEFGERKNILALVESIFAGFGKEVGSKQEPMYRFDFEQLFAVVAMYRSVTRSYLMHILEEAEQCAPVSGASGVWECRVEATGAERASGGSNYYADDDE